MKCIHKNCDSDAVHDQLFCNAHFVPGAITAGIGVNTITNSTVNTAENSNKVDQPVSAKYSKYYKQIPEGVKELDIYMLCHIFKVEDHSGALQHAIKKMLLPGVRTGGKSRYDDIKEARDTLTRWLEVNK